MLSKKFKNFTHKNLMVKGKKILITGGEGFIGSWLVERFYKNNEITCFDNGRRNAFKYLDESVKKQVKLTKGDILNKNAVKKAVKNCDIVLHLAAIAGASSYNKNPLLTLQVNLFGTANLLEVASYSSLKKIILFSTSETYGPFAKNVSEQTPTVIGPAGEGRWSYAISKLSSDHLAMAYFKMRQIPVTIVRPFNIYGPRQVGEGAITSMFLSALTKKTVSVTGNGRQKRAWCFVSDFVDGIEKMLAQKTNGQIYNIGNPTEYYTINQLARKISQLTDAKIIYTTAIKTEIIERLPNIDKANLDLGFKPKTSLDKGLKETKQWFEKYLELPAI